MARRRAGVGKGKKGHQHIQEEELTLLHTHTHTHTHGSASFTLPSEHPAGDIVFLELFSPLLDHGALASLLASSSTLDQPRCIVQACAAQQMRAGYFRQSMHHFPQPSGLFQGWIVCPVKVMREEMFEEIERESFPALLRDSLGVYFFFLLHMKEEVLAPEVGVQQFFFLISNLLLVMC